MDAKSLGIVRPKAPRGVGVPVNRLAGLCVAALLFAVSKRGLIFLIIPEN